MDLEAVGKKCVRRCIFAQKPCGNNPGPEADR
jgi:hypothetical protein